MGRQSLDTELHSLCWVSGTLDDSMDQSVKTWAYTMLSISSGQALGLLLHHSPQWTLHILTEIPDKLITEREEIKE